MSDYDHDLASLRMRTFVDELNRRIGPRVGFHATTDELKKLADEYGIGPSYSGVTLYVERVDDFIRVRHANASEELTLFVVAVDHMSGGSRPTTFTLFSPP